MQNILVVFYSKTGNTKKTAIEIARILGADIDEIFDNQNREGVKGWFSGCKDANYRNLVSIKYKKKPDEYKLVIIGTPIWAFNMAPAVRTYIKENKDALKRVAFFSTSGGIGIEKTFNEMEKISEKPIATLALQTLSLHLNIDKNNLEKINKFCDTQFFI